MPDQLPNPAHLLQAFFILASSTILLLNAFPTLRSRFITYGSRATPVEDQRRKTSHVNRLLDGLAAIRVSHSRFKDFYIVSTLSSLFWLIQIITRSALWMTICRMSSGSMSIDQVFITWSLLFSQGIRRLIETRRAKHSASKMWFVHWLLGIVFYLAVGISVWIEASIASVITLSPPSLRTMVAVPMFILASGIQHDCHMYLDSLPKYTLPTHPIFNSLVCPHYTAECVIYLSLAIVSAPKGEWINRTMFAAFIFVSVNVSTTASNTKEWYERKFGREAVAHRWTMIPGVW